MSAVGDVGVVDVAVDVGGGSQGNCCQGVVVVVEVGVGCDGGTEHSLADSGGRDPVHINVCAIHVHLFCVYKSDSPFL